MLFFADILKVNDEYSRIRTPDPDPNPDPDPLVRGMDPRIRIRIHPKMSWIRNTATSTHKLTNRSSVGDPDPQDPHVFGPP